jgi:hypothetical protein
MADEGSRAKAIELGTSVISTMLDNITERLRRSAVSETMADGNASSA